MDPKKVDLLLQYALAVAAEALVVAVSDRTSAVTAIAAICTVLFLFIRTAPFRLLSMDFCTASVLLPQFNQ